MLRRALLVAALLAPLAARAAMTCSPTTLWSLNGCTANPSLKLNWTMPTGTTTPLSGWTYRVLVSTTDECVTTGTPLVVASDLDAGLSLSGAYPVAGSGVTLSLGSLLSKTSTSCGTSPALYLCAQLMNGSTWVASSDRVTLQVWSEPPATPTAVQVSPGDSALNVSWTAGTGTDGSFPVARYRAEAWTCADATDTVCSTFATSADSAGTTTTVRIPNLTIGTRYKVLVFALASIFDLSDDGTFSPSAPAAYGTPIQVFSFWDQYSAAPAGGEQGGCGGGAAGLLSLVAVAGLLRARRRRS